MDEMEMLAQWHDSRTDFWRGKAIVKLPTEAAEHTAAAATIRVAMAENARLREALQLADYALRGCNMNLRVVERKVSAALATQTKEQDA